VPAAELAANPANFRTHDDRQRTVFRTLLEEIGFAGASLAYYSERAGGLLTLIDGHLRKEEVGPDFAMACAITDLTDAEADKLIAAFDAVSGMAGTDPAKLDELLARVQTESEALHGLLKSLAENAGLYAAEWSGVAPESINELDPYDPTTSPSPGFGVQERGHCSKSYLAQKMKWARGRRVHWLGYTQAPMLLALRPYSCDSASWAEGFMWGQLRAYAGNGRWINDSKYTGRHRIDCLALQQIIRRHGFTTKDFHDPARWKSGGGEKRSRHLPAIVTTDSYVRYAFELQARFNVRYFLATGAAGADWLLDAIDRNVGAYDAAIARLDHLAV